MVEVKKLVKSYGTKVALNNISFTLGEGEILGFLGPNGAGKSTTMNIITGYIAPTNGTVIVDGYDIMKNPKKAKSKIGYLPEQPPLYMDMTVKGYLSFIYDLKKIKLKKDEHISEICEKVGIISVYNSTIKKLSKGYKQRVGIAQALLGYPPVIILDEPTVGLDPKQIMDIRKLIKSLSKEHTVILSSHILPEVQSICDRIIVINSGKIVADGTTDEIAHGSSGKSFLVIHVEGAPETVLDILKTTDGVISIGDGVNQGDEVYEYILEYDESEDIRRNLFRKLAKHDFPIIKLDRKDSSLEDVFLELTSKNTDIDLICSDDSGDEVLEISEDSEDDEDSVIEAEDFSEQSQEPFDNIHEDSSFYTNENKSQNYENNDENIESGEDNI